MTIAIPAYNCGATIRFTVLSVLNQTYKDFELIVTDDGSTDGTLQELRTIKDSRLVVLTDGENRGISYRLNQQIDLARGAYFVRMDGDDIMMPDRIEKQLRLLESDPKLDTCGGQAVVVDDDNRILGLRGRTDSAKSISDVFLRGRFIHPTVMGKTEWFRKWRYREDMCGCEDLDLWLRSFSSSSFGDCSSPVLFYRDPLVFKLQTFLKRQRQIVRCYWLNRHLMNNILLFAKCYVKVAIATVCSTILCVFGQDKRWIARRNVPIISDRKIEYERILTEVSNLR